MPEKPVYKCGPMGFLPINEPAWDFISKSRGKEVALILKRERNLNFHRKGWALLNTIFDAQEQYEDPEQLRLALTIAAGHVDYIKLLDGGVTLYPKSWAFDKMSEEEFEHLYNRMIDEGLKLLPGEPWLASEKILGFA